MAILEECLRGAMPPKRACEYAKVAYDTFLQWMQDDLQFRLKMAFAKSHGIRSLIAATARKDPWKILKNLDAEHFRDVVEVSVAEEKEDVEGGKGTTTI